MKPFQPFLASLSILLVLSPVVQGQQPMPPAPPTVSASGLPLNDPATPLKWTAPNSLERFVKPYQRRIIKPTRFSDSGRLASLIRAGNIYLSLQDAIALALENNLDIEVARFGPMIADMDVLRSSAGGLLRGISTAVSQGPGSASSQITGSSTAGSQAVTTGTASSSAVLTQTGTPIPSFDPLLTANSTLGHFSTPQSNTVTTGTNNLFSDTKTYNVALQEWFPSGTNVAASFNFTDIKSNNRLNQLNPSLQSAATLSLSQHLLQGFGLAVNTRNIRVAKLNRQVSDLVFEQQVIATVSAVIVLYWNLVAFNEDLRVKKESISLSQKLYTDNQKQVEIGTLAKIEVTRAEAEVASREQDLTVSQTAVLQQETILKNALSRNGVASEEVYAARVTPTDSLRLSTADPIPSIQELIDQALANRPELRQTKLNVETSRISLSGSKNGLLPTFDLQAALTNNALAGDPNFLRVGDPTFNSPSVFFVGGGDTALAQLFKRNFPSYSVAFQLNVPIRNRQAQADYTRDSLSLRQQELRERQQINQIRVDVQNAMIGLAQNRSRYLAAAKAKQLQEQALDAEQKKYALGASTIYLVIQAQRDLATAQGNEVSAMAGYATAKVQLELATGQTLSANRISLDEAKMGSVSRAADIPKP